MKGFVNADHISFVRETKSGWKVSFYSGEQLEISELQAYQLLKYMNNKIQVKIMEKASGKSRSKNQVQG